MSYQSPAHHYPPPPAPTKPAGLAIASLVLGIVGCVLSYMPLINNISAAGAVVGLVLGVVGLWRSRPVMSLIGGFLSGVAVILTVLAQQQLSDELDKIGDDLDASLSSLSAAPTAPSAAPVDRPEPVTRPAASDLQIELRITDKQCYGSAGCNVTVVPEMTYTGLRGVDSFADYTVTFAVTGDESGEVISTLWVTGADYSAEPLMLMTASGDVVPTAEVTSVD